MLGKLHAIKARFDELHIDFVPSLGCGSGGQENGGTTARANTAEGVWARNISLREDVATRRLHPVIGLRGLSIPANGNFSGTVGRKSGAPTGWSTESGTQNVSEWSVADDDPWQTPSARSMRCDVTQAPGGSSSYLYSDTMQVQPGQVLQLQFWGKVVPNRTGTFPKFELILPRGPAGHPAGGEFALELDIGGAESDDVHLTPKPGQGAVSANWTEWTRAQLNVRVPQNCSVARSSCELYLMIRLQGQSTATWWLSGIEFLNLDAAMRNIVRTNASDVELRDPDSHKRFTLGRDFEVVNPPDQQPPSESANSAHHLYIDQLPEYWVRSLEGGRIPRGGTVLASFDYLPGKVNQQGHSTPGAFGEPGYYKLLRGAIRNVMTQFGAKEVIKRSSQTCNFAHRDIGSSSCKCLIISNDDVDVSNCPDKHSSACVTSPE